MGQAESTLVETVGQNGTTIEIRRYVVGNKLEFRFPWRDEHGKRHFRCCRTLEEAKESAQQFCSGIHAPESSGPSSTDKHSKLTPELLAEAARLLGVPGPRNLLTYDQTFAEISDEFLAAKDGKLRRAEIRAETYRELQSRVRNLKELMGAVTMDEMTTDQMDKAMSKLNLSPRSVSNCRDVLRGILRWATNRSKAPDSVLKHFAGMAVTGSKTKDAEKIDPFTRAEVAEILNEARNNTFDPTRSNFRMVTAIALQAFGGLRAAEACKLPWEQIDLQNGLVRITPNFAKTKSPRTIELPANLHKWLNLVPQQARKGPIYTGGAYSKAQGRLARRVAKRVEGFRWRDNALRQAFIANHIAFSDSISETAYRAGTSESKIRTNYWKLVSGSDARSYFNIVP